MDLLGTFVESVSRKGSYTNLRSTRSARSAGAQGQRRETAAATFVEATTRAVARNAPRLATFTLAVNAQPAPAVTVALATVRRPAVTATSTFAPAGQAEPLAGVSLPVSVNANGARLTRAFLAASERRTVAGAEALAPLAGPPPETEGPVVRAPVPPDGLPVLPPPAVPPPVGPPPFGAPPVPPSPPPVGPPSPVVPSPPTFANRSPALDTAWTVPNHSPAGRPAALAA